MQVCWHSCTRRRVLLADIGWLLEEMNTCTPQRTQRCTKIHFMSERSY
jgi:hypothetical protein